MRILVDTNVFCRLADEGSPSHGIAKNAIGVLKNNGHDVCLVPQVIYEYWVVATRATNVNGLGMSASAVEHAIEVWLDVFRLVRDERGIFTKWREIVTRYEVQGKKAHDARLVAAMLRHGITHLLTFDSGDFRRYSEISILAPSDVS